MSRRRLSLRAAFAISLAVTPIALAGCPFFVPFFIDRDGDGVGNSTDNCPNDSNPTQADTDADGVGDACDNCPTTANANQADTDNDGVGNLCDNCPTDSNPNQLDGDGDGFGEVCDADDGNPGVH
ncbi:MAG: thrombospondin type 3 repeat-containing protein [Phycisphaerae bacterium]|nr:thrombospondin type 3 repeat-containing protein [Phycisphaerae bacterium]